MTNNTKLLLDKYEKYVNTIFHKKFDMHPNYTLKDWLEAQRLYNRNKKFRGAYNIKFGVRSIDDIKYT